MLAMDTWQLEFSPWITLVEGQNQPLLVGTGTQTQIIRLGGNTFTC